VQTTQRIVMEEGVDALALRTELGTYPGER